jgi:hypothetical protein
MTQVFRLLARNANIYGPSRLKAGLSIRYSTFFRESLEAKLALCFADMPFRLLGGENVVFAVCD